MSPTTPSRLLDCFTADEPRLRIADLRRLTGLPATAVARIAKTLVSQDLLEKDGDEYRLGIRVLVWSAPATVGSDVVAAAGPVVEQVRDRPHETAGFYVRQGTNRVTVAAALSTYSVVYRGYVGQARPLHAGAAGKVFMAAEEIELGLNSVAAPVYGATGAVVGVLACGGPFFRLTGIG